MCHIIGIHVYRMNHKHIITHYKIMSIIFIQKIIIYNIFEISYGLLVLFSKQFTITTNVRLGRLQVYTSVGKDDFTYIMYLYTFQS